MNELEQRFKIRKNERGGRLPWSVVDTLSPDAPLPIFPSKKKAKVHACRTLLADHQDIFAESYRAMCREQGDEYTFRDSLDALIHMATYTPDMFIALLPGLRERGESINTYEIEFID